MDVLGECCPSGLKSTSVIGQPRPEDRWNLALTGREPRVCAVSTVHPAMTPGLIIAAKNAPLGQKGVCQNSDLSSSAGRLLRKRCMAAIGIVR